jgi:hypothetical protein
MSANESPDPTVAEADRRVERAKASLLARVEVLKHKLGDARNQIDLRAQIAKHPLPAIGIAFGLGVFAAMRGGSRAEPREPGEHSLTGAALGALAAFGLRLARDFAIGELGQAAKRWWVEQHDGSRSDVQSSLGPDLEPFLER